MALNWAGSSRDRESRGAPRAAAVCRELPGPGRHRVSLALCLCWRPP